MTKKYGVVLTVLFCVFTGGICLASLLLPKKEFSELENRSLARPPVLSLEALGNGSFMDQAEDYAADHIALRDLWVALKASSERLSGKQENGGVYFGKADTLIARVEEPDAEKLERDIGYVDTLAGSTSIPVYFGLIPSAAAVWADRLPAGAPTADEVSYINKLYFSTGANTVGLYEALSAHAEEDIYYRTDHHWTSLGAFYGANAIFEAMDLEPLDLSDYEKTTVSEDFNGTSFSSSGARWLPPDAIDVYIPEDGVEVTAYFTGEPEQGSLYVERFLQVKDKYSFFLGGRQPLCVIRSEKNDGPKIAVVRDSYSDSLAPFLTERFSEVHLIDPRNNYNSVRDYAERSGLDAILVLYSFANFTTDQNLFVLAR